MRWLVFYDDYLPFHEEKDIGQIATGLGEIGDDVVLVTYVKEDLKGYKAPFALKQIKRIEEILNGETYDRAIVYSWIDPRYNNTLAIIKKIAGLIIVKADSDGRIGTIGEPKRRYDLLKKTTNRPIWKIIPRVLRSCLLPLGSKIENGRVSQVELADKIVIESPDAAQNICSFLSRKQRYDLINKIAFIPDPVTPEFSRENISNANKRNIVVSIGRWEDWVHKNTKKMIKVLTDFTERKENWESIVIGPGLDSKLPYKCKKIQEKSFRIHILGEIRHSEIKKYLMEAKILFMPSRSESFGIAAGEALCQGCSVVGSPIESMRFLTMQGFSGNVASSFTESSFLGTLLYEAMKWEKNEKDSAEIAIYWKKRLDREVIAREYHNLFKK